MPDWMDGQVKMCFPDSWYGRTSSERSAATAAKTSAPSWRKLLGSQNRAFLFLDMSGGGGLPQELLSETDGVSHGERMTLNIGEYPNGGVALLFSPISMGVLPRKSCLSAILEENPDPKYNLTPKACQGILNRAERRGKKLPKILYYALRKQAGQ